MLKFFFVFSLLFSSFAAYSHEPQTYLLEIGSPVVFKGHSDENLNGKLGLIRGHSEKDGELFYSIQMIDSKVEVAPEFVQRKIRSKVTLKNPKEICLPWLACKVGRVEEYLVEEKTYNVLFSHPFNQGKQIRINVDEQNLVTYKPSSAGSNKVLERIFR